MNRPFRLACTAALLTLPGLSQASAFAIPENSITGLGLANAVVANPHELGAITYNPAAASFHPGATLSAGLMPVHPTLKVTTSAGSFTSQGPDYVFLPLLQGTYQVTDKFTLGLGVTVPFGLETDWPLGTFPGLSSYDPDGPTGTPVPPTFGTLPPGALQTTRSKLEVVQATPTVSMRLSPEAAVAVGLDYFMVREVVFDSAASTTTGNGNGWGWNAAFLYAKGPWSLGASFHAKADVDVDGASTLTTLVSTSSAPATATVPLPWRAQLGMRYQMNKQTALEFDITRTGWSEFDVLTIHGVSTTTSTNNWKDANAYRLGGTYQLTPATQLRAGYSYDTTGQPDAYYSARIPDADRHLLSIGIGHDLGNGLQLEAGYMYVHLKERTFQASTPYPVAPSGSVDPNGTSAYNGAYKSNVQLLGVGISKRF